MAEEVARQMTPPREVAAPRLTRNQVNSPAGREPIRQHQAQNPDITVPVRGSRRRGQMVENIQIDDDDDGE